MKRFYTLAIIIGIVILVVAVAPMPFPYHIKGTITNWIGNDNGFGIIVNNQIYCLSYGGSGNLSQIDMRTLVGDNCSFSYLAPWYDSHGNMPGYATLLSFTVYNNSTR